MANLLKSGSLFYPDPSFFIAGWGKNFSHAQKFKCLDVSSSARKYVAANLYLSKIK